MLKKTVCFGSRGRITSRQKTLVINELKHKYKITLILKVADISRSAYYYHCNQLKKADKYIHVKAEIQRIYDENKGRYGYRRITQELRKTEYYVNHKTVLRLMKQIGLCCCVRMKKTYKTYRGQANKKAPNILKRYFKAYKPNQKWVTDVTEFKLLGTKIYLSPVIDLYNGEVISYNLSDRANFDQITDMLDKAFEKIDDNTGLIMHSDQGWQYTMKDYQRMLKEKGIRQSMSRKGNCYDNACAESFFASLKTELLYLQHFSSIEEFESEVHDYIEWYNTKRIKLKLGWLSPVEYRLRNT